MDQLAQWFQGVQAEFVLNFIEKERWRLLLNGLGNTLLMSLMAVIIGVILGMVIALTRSTWDNLLPRQKKGVGGFLLRIANRICVLYTTVIRGTPVVIQLLIMYYIIFTSSNNGLMVATLSFGLNSAAYVSEIIRGGIMSMERGQMEAGRSLGFNYLQTMWYIIAPQVLRQVLPPLANEFIVLLKETSVAGYVTVADLTFAGNRIRGITYSAFMPLVAVALIYLALVVVLTLLVGKLERRLRRSDHRS